MSEGLTKQEVSAADGKDEIHVRWVMPEAFEDLPLGQDEDEIVRRLEDLAQKFLPGADDDLLVRWCLLCVLGCSDLEAAGTQYAGLCAVDIDGEPCVTTVFATLSPGDAITAGVGDPVTSLVAGLRAMDLGEVSEIELPCGTAVCCVGARVENPGGHLADLGPQTGEIRTSFIQVHIPLSNGTVLSMEMGTPTMTGWETFSETFARIVRSIRLFTADGSAVPLSVGVGR